MKNEYTIKSSSIITSFKWKTLGFCCCFIIYWIRNYPKIYYIYTFTSDIIDYDPNSVI